MEQDQKAVNEVEDMKYPAPGVEASRRFVSFVLADNKVNVLLVGWGIGLMLTACF